MIVNCDAKALEWVVGAYLSKDKIAYEEIRAGVDQHSLNQKAFNLPSRLIAKTFVFRLMYGGQAYSYAHDPDFTDVSSSEKFWQKVIDAFYEKYSGFREWHIKIVQEAMNTGCLVMPTGRVYEFEPKVNWRGDLQAPETIIKNYPVQGLGADMMSIARVDFARRFNESNIEGYIVNTVHDSVVCDIREEVQATAILFHQVFNDLPSNFEHIFKVPFDLPMKCEVSVGPNMKDLTEIVV